VAPDDASSCASGAFPLWIPKLDVKRRLESRRSTRAANSMKQAFFEQLQAQSHSLPVVQRKNTDGCPPDGRKTFDKRSIPQKMVMPIIATGMEKHRDLAIHWVDSSKVRPFLAIAVVAG
jgi:hypothetical protein